MSIRDTDVNGADDAWLEQVVRKAKHSRTLDSWIIWIERVAIIGALIGGWQLFVSAFKINPDILSSPSAVGSTLYHLLQQRVFYYDLRVTSEEVLFGLLLGVISGSVIGIVFILLPRISDALQPLLVGLNSMPKIALAPLTIIWFGLGIYSKILLAALGVFFIIFFNIAAGGASLDKAVMDNLAIMGISRRKIVTIFILPSVATWIIAALKVAISAALIGAVIGEYIGANAGIGYEIENAINSLSIARMFTLLLVLAIMGGLAYALIALVERRLLRWSR
ncbi:MAG TPA: ABC transporter permease [Acidimicrobiales bacterium]|nr:ABC transporter permease [Acidimicrobiales bacterium]